MNGFLAMNAMIEKLSVKDIPDIRALFLREGAGFLRRTFGFIPGRADLRRLTVDDPDFSPELFLGVRTTHGLAGCIAGVYRSWKKSRISTGFVKWVLVDARYRRQGIGTRLLANCEDALRVLGAEKLSFGPSSPLYLVPGAPVESEGLGDFLTASGWNQGPVRNSLYTSLDNVTVSAERFAQLKKRHAALSIGCAAPSHEAEIASFTASVFSISWAREVCNAVVDPERAFCSVIREKKSSAIAGFAAVNGTNPFWFGPMGVRMDLRNQGLGTLLVCHAFMTARKRGMKYLLIPWINGKEDFYSKFVREKHWQRYFKFEKVL
jgi:predicted N-acetyltransferase YhbS